MRIKLSISLVLFSFLFINISFAANNNACSITNLKEGKACDAEKQTHKTEKQKDQFINDIENIMKSVEKEKK